MAQVKEGAMFSTAWPAPSNSFFLSREKVRAEDMVVPTLLLIGAPRHIERTIGWKPCVVKRQKMIPKPLREATELSVARCPSHRPQSNVQSSNL